MSEVLVIAPTDQAALDQGHAALMEATYQGWLLSLPRAAGVGYARLSSQCPLCGFLFLHTGRRWLIDGRRAYLIDTLAYVPGIVLPRWAERHVVQLDVHFGQRVCAGEVLALLEGRTSDGNSGSGTAAV